jgi:hypothetical protein
VGATRLTTLNHQVDALERFFTEGNEGTKGFEPGSSSLSSLPSVHVLSLAVAPHWRDFLQKATKEAKVF